MTWPKVLLGEFMSKRQGAVDPSKRPDVAFDLLSIPAFDAGEPTAVLGRGIGSSKQRVSPGDVLLSRIVPHIRRAWVVPPTRGREQIASGEWMVFRSPHVDPEWLKFMLTGNTFHSELMRTVSGVGGSLLRARPAYVAKIEIPLPPLAEQRRIAAILDKADALRTKRCESISALESLAAEMYFEMTATREFETATVDDVSNSMSTGPFGSDLLHSEFVNSGIAVLGIDNAVQNRFAWSERRFITHEKYQKLARYTVNPGDVLITIMGTCGRCAVVPDDIPPAINTKHLCRITLDRTRVDPRFMHAGFLYDPVAHDYLQRTSKGSIMSGLNLGIIKRMPLLVPPMEVQQRFAERARQVDTFLDRQRAHLAELDALFASLQQRAFAGELA